MVGLRRLGCEVEAEPEGALLALFRQELQLPFQRPRDLVLGFLGVAAGAAVRFGRLGSRGRTLVIAVSQALMPRPESGGQSKRIQRAVFGTFVVHLTQI